VHQNIAIEGTVRKGKDSRREYNKKSNEKEGHRWHGMEDRKNQGVEGNQTVFSPKRCEGAPVPTAQLTKDKGLRGKGAGE